MLLSRKTLKINFLYNVYSEIKFASLQILTSQINIKYSFYCKSNLEKNDLIITYAN